MFESHVNQPRQEGPGRQDDRVGLELNADLRNHPGDTVAVDQQILDRLLEEREPRSSFEPSPDRPAIEHTVSLRPGRTNRRALAGVENPELDPRLVGGERHCPAERIDLLDQMPLADPPDRRIAGHLAKRFDAVRQQQRAAPRARRHQSGLGAGMASSDNDHFEALVNFIENQRIDDLTEVIGQRRHCTRIRRALRARANAQACRHGRWPQNRRREPSRNRVASPRRPELWR